MAPSDTFPVCVAADAICQRLGAVRYDRYVGPEGDYLRLVGHASLRADISVSCLGLSEGRFSVQVCLGGDPLDIIYDDECDLANLLDLCERFLVPGGPA